MILWLVGIPLASAVLALVLPARLALWLNALGALCALLVSGLLLTTVLSGGVPPVAVRGMLRADGLGVLLAVVVAAAAAPAALLGVWEFSGDAHYARRYAVLASALLAALLCTVLADHLGVLWITLELAAVFSAFLVGFRGGRPALEAAFKYMLLGSVGLVLGLLATAVVHRAGVPVLGYGDDALSFEKLRAHGAALSPHTLRVALALAAAGYGVKIGLFPLHVWKPDVYAAAPAPVTALLAGAVVVVPLGALVRFGALASAAGQGHFTSQLFVGAGCLSVLAAMFMIAGERDLRRILAFTSVEHLGLSVLALGLEPGAVRAGLYHLFTNGTLKALAFGLLGMVVSERGTGDTESGSGLYRRSPGLSALFLLAMAAALGFPPFGMFASELAVLRALFAGGHVALGFVVTLALAAIFGVVAAGTLRVVFARSEEEAAHDPPFARGAVAAAVACPVLVGMAWIGIAMPGSLWSQFLTVARGFAP
jgi:hydrogenase-4 component F